jgi:rSAM/selenodomain-associated transferase 1
VQAQAAEEQQYNFMKEAIIVFVKNLQSGKVKTRLAAEVGNEEAFKVYKALLNYTHNVVRSLTCDKYIFYSDYTDENDIWSQNDCIKILQSGNDLGERMLLAFSLVFKKNHNKVLIIGSDCPELKSAIIEQGFEHLNDADVVIGPATDGGYYLLGMKRINKSLFENIAWSTESVLAQTLAGCVKEGLSYSLLPILNDIDKKGDWIKFSNLSKLSFV